jgi:hypothetical protein
MVSSEADGAGLQPLTDCDRAVEQKIIGLSALSGEEIGFDDRRALEINPYAGMNRIRFEGFPR